MSTNTSTIPSNHRYRLIVTIATWGARETMCFFAPNDDCAGKVARAYVRSFCATTQAKDYGITRENFRMTHIPAKTK